MADNYPRGTPPAPVQTRIDPSGTNAPWAAYFKGKPLFCCTFVYGGGGAAGPVLTLGSTNQIPVGANEAGSPVYGIASIDAASAGADVHADILWRGASCLTSPIVIPAGSTALVYFSNFIRGTLAPIQFQEGDRLQGVILQIGTTSAGASLCLRLFWQP